MNINPYRYSKKMVGRNSNRQKVKQSRKKVIPFCYQRTNSSSLNHTLNTGIYKRRIKELLKNNKALAVALENARSESSVQSNLLKDYARDCNQIQYARIKLRSMATTINKLVTDLDEVMNFLDVNWTGKEVKFSQRYKSPNYNIRMKIRAPDVNCIEEVSTLSSEHSASDEGLSQDNLSSPVNDIPPQKLSLNQRENSDSRSKTVPADLNAAQLDSLSLSSQPDSVLSQLDSHAPILFSDDLNEIDKDVNKKSNQKTSSERSLTPELQVCHFVRKSSKSNERRETLFNASSSSNFDRNCIDKDVGENVDCITKPAVLSSRTMGMEDISQLKCSDNLGKNCVKIYAERPNMRIDNQDVTISNLKCKISPITQNALVLQMPANTEYCVPNQTVLLCEDMELTDVIPTVNAYFAGNSVPTSFPCHNSLLEKAKMQSRNLQSANERNEQSVQSHCQKELPSLQESGGIKDVENNTCCNKSSSIEKSTERDIQKNISLQTADEINNAETDLCAVKINKRSSKRGNQKKSISLKPAEKNKAIESTERDIQKDISLKTADEINDAETDSCFVKITKRSSKRGSQKKISLKIAEENKAIETTVCPAKQINDTETAIGGLTDHDSAFEKKLSRSKKPVNYLEFFSSESDTDSVTPVKLPVKRKCKMKSNDAPFSSADQPQNKKVKKLPTENKLSEQAQCPGFNNKATQEDCGVYDIINVSDSVKNSDIKSSNFATRSKTRNPKQKKVKTAKFTHEKYIAKIPVKKMTNCVESDTIVKSISKASLKRKSCVKQQSKNNLPSDECNTNSDIIQSEKEDSLIAIINSAIRDKRDVSELNKSISSTLTDCDNHTPSKSHRNENPSTPLSEKKRVSFAPVDFIYSFKKASMPKAISSQTKRISKSNLDDVTGFQKLNIALKSKKTVENKEVAVGNNCFKNMEEKISQISTSNTVKCNPVSNFIEQKMNQNETFTKEFSSNEPISDPLNNEGDSSFTYGNEPVLKTLSPVHNSSSVFNAETVDHSNVRTAGSLEGTSLEITNISSKTNASSENKKLNSRKLYASSKILPQKSQKHIVMNDADKLHIETCLPMEQEDSSDENKSSDVNKESRKGNSCKGSFVKGMKHQKKENLTDEWKCENQKSKSNQNTNEINLKANLPLSSEVDCGGQFENHPVANRKQSLKSDSRKFEKRKTKNNQSSKNAESLKNDLLISSKVDCSKETKNLSNANNEQSVSSKKILKCAVQHRKDAMRKADESNESATKLKKHSQVENSSDIVHLRKIIKINHNVNTELEISDDNILNYVIPENVFSQTPDLCSSASRNTKATFDDQLRDVLKEVRENALSTGSLDLHSCREGEDAEGVRKRRSKTISYKEPSLRLKMRR